MSHTAGQNLLGVWEGEAQLPTEAEAALALSRHLPEHVHTGGVHTGYATESYGIKGAGREQRVPGA